MLQKPIYQFNSIFTSLQQSEIAQIASSAYCKWCIIIYMSYSIHIKPFITPVKNHYQSSLSLLFPSSVSYTHSLVLKHSCANQILWLFSARNWHFYSWHTVIQNGLCFYNRNYSANLDHFSPLLYSHVDIAL